MSQPNPPASQEMRLLAIRNPASGQENDGFDAFVTALRGHGAVIEVRDLGGQAKLEELLQDAPEFARVVAAGGDGTVSAVAHALAGSTIPVMVYPAGTANLVALNLSLPTAPEALAEVALNGRAVAMDLARLRFPDGETLGITLNAGAGLDARIVEGSEDLKPRLGVGAYLASALQNANPTVARFHLELDGHEVGTEGIGAMVVNHGRLQLGLELAPDADATDGELEVIVIRARSLVGLAPVVLGRLLERLGLGAPDFEGRLEVMRASHVRVSSDPPLPVQYDGESTGRSTPFEVSVLPRAALFIVGSSDNPSG